MITTSAARLQALGPLRATLLLTLVVTLLHLLAAGRVPLSADEAHYALYGLHPDWSYFDHPPMVGWMQALVLRFADSEFALRLWPILLSALTALVLFAYTRRLFPQDSPWLGFFTVAFYQSGVLFQLLGLALVPETPLLFFTLLALLALLRALDHDHWRLRDDRHGWRKCGKCRSNFSAWLTFGLCLGLAGLSKYTAVTLTFTAALFVVLQRGRESLGDPKLWMALFLSAFVALLVITPVLYWNIEHDWLSFRYQLGHGFRAKDWEWSRVGLSQLGQLFAYAPGLYVFGLIALVAAARAWRERGVQLTLLLVVPVLLLFVSGSGHEETLPHWTALAWAGVTPLATRWIMQHWTRRPVRVLLYVSAGYSLIVLALLYTLLLVPALPFPGARHPLSPLLGWPEAAARAAALRADFSREEPGAVLLVPNWSLASRLAWYARPLPVQVTDTRFDQFDLWFGTPRPGTDGVLVVPDSMLKTGRRMLSHFAACRESEPYRVVREGRTVVTFYFYLCRDYRGPDDGPVS
jgi:4-amino-4-deoxy-L-arabinose transferase-like glycosyltransferase